MEESGKLPESDYTGAISGALHGFLAISDDEGDEFLPGLSFKEEMVEEVMQELWKEISCSTYTNPTSSPANFTSSLMSPSSFVDGKNESCGPSFSDLASTVMAGIEMGGGVAGTCSMGPTRKVANGKAELPTVESGSWVLEKGCYGMGVSEGFGERMDGCDGVELDDEWLARVLSWGPLEVNEWT